MFGVPFVPGKVTEVNVLQPGGVSRVAEMQIVSTSWQDRPSYLATLHDITDRKRAEDEAREGVRAVMNSWQSCRTSCEIRWRQSSTLRKSCTSGRLKMKCSARPERLSNAKASK